MKINNEGKEIIKKHEGVKYLPYLCPAGVLTVGWGHTGSDIVKSKAYTYKECEYLLDKDLAVFEKSVNSLIKIPLNNNQFSALVCFVFNLGTSCLNNSTLLKRLNKGDPPNIVARDELKKFINITYTDKNGKSQKKELDGLKRRRASEIALFTKPVQNGC